jgi:nucleoside-diphosphate-sugar epimerase
LKHFDREFAATNRLRTEGTDNLLAGARAAGVQRFIAQSFTGWTNPREGSRVKNEDDPLDPHPPHTMQQTLDAIRYLERAVSEASGVHAIVLRYGYLYGPGTSFAPGGDILEAVRSRRFPIVGTGAGVWSFVHVDDIAMATVIAAESAPSGLYNVVDDEPAEAGTWLPELARVVGAKPPRHVPVWLARLMIGDAGVALMTQSRGSSNVKIKRAFAWQPLYRTWRDGFRRGLSDDAQASAAA